MADPTADELHAHIAFMESKMAGCNVKKNTNDAKHVVGLKNGMKMSASTAAKITGSKQGQQRPGTAPVQPSLPATAVLRLQQGNSRLTRQFEKLEEELRALKVMKAGKEVRRGTAFTTTGPSEAIDAFDASDKAGTVRASSTRHSQSRSLIPQGQGQGQQSSPLPSRGNRRQKGNSPSALPLPARLRSAPKLGTVAASKEDFDDSIDPATLGNEDEASGWQSMALKTMRKIVTESDQIKIKVKRFLYAYFKIYFFNIICFFCIITMFAIFYLWMFFLTSGI